MGSPVNAHTTNALPRLLDKRLTHQVLQGGAHTKGGIRHAHSALVLPQCVVPINHAGVRSLDDRSDARQPPIPNPRSAWLATRRARRPLPPASDTPLWAKPDRAANGTLSMRPWSSARSARRGTVGLPSRRRLGSTAVPCSDMPSSRFPVNERSSVA